ncbi:chitin deacetylase [Crucibulum laeve]|uniref:chitin deacetylase n=1 Tax=Crucibulum laeve TaxID=68775 RepID=A0A5C3LK48_9AGAR|nr:chitin deacetylase [Crucibulum laeve]
MILSAALGVVLGASIPSPHDHGVSHQMSKRLPSTWYHADDHPAHALFKRATNDGVTYPTVGSPAWSAQFPAASPQASDLPKAWTDALAAAIAAGKIPNIPPSTGKPQTNPVYPAGMDPNGPEICSATYKCRHADDIWDAPDGYFGISFDDGPQPATSELVQFLDQNNETATHFMIGINILSYPSQFTEAFNADGDIAVHTWTHPYMTTLSNEDVLGQLGWTAELIHHSTGGRLPKFWRPPYGDSDNRVRAIAQEVFGLTTIIWNQDTEDWSLTSGGTTPAQVHTQMTQWLSGSKSPGLIILEHELSDASVHAFMDAYPLIKSNGWKTESLAQLIGDGRAYQNAAESDSNDVIPVANGVLVGNSSVSTSNSASTPGSSSVSTVGNTSGAPASTSSR